MVHTQEGSVLHLCTKFEADCSIPSKVIKESQKARPFWTLVVKFMKNPCTHIDCWILFFYLYPFLSYGWKQCEWAILMAKLAMRMRGVTWPVIGVIRNHIFWNQRPQFAYSLYNFYRATATIREFIWEHPHCKAVLGRKVPSKSGPKWRFFGNYGV